jgi:DedD protein
MMGKYTGEATMDEPALRDVDRWKEKIEVRLDNRQVFFLFFGSAMVACLLFVLGVIVGKRLESRGRAEAAPGVEDPLAALDRLSAPGVGIGTRAPGAAVAGTASDAALTFPRALAAPSTVGKLASLPRPLAAPARAASAPAAAGRPPAAAVRPAPAPAPAPAPVPVPVPVPVPAPTPAAVTVTVAVAPPSKPVAAAPPKPVLTPPKPATPAPVKAAAVKPAIAPAPAPAAARGKYLLHLSTFASRQDAEAFARRFENAYVMASDAPGKGTVYRVRVGNYGTIQEAAAAKSAFEQRHSVIAYVAGGGPPAKP